MPAQNVLSRNSRLFTWVLEKIYLWLPVIVWGAIIFTFSSSGAPSVSQVYWKDFVVKKIAHLVEYAVLAILLFRAMKGSGVNSTNSMLYSILVSFFYAVTDEFHQSFTPGREPTVRDVVIDSVGSMMAMFSLKYFSDKFPKRIRNFLYL
jgi:hypothetical protein